MAKVSTHRLVIPSRLDQVPQVQQAILETAQEAGFERNTCFAIRLALDEALSNAIRHGNCNDPEKQVTVEYEVTDRAEALLTALDQTRSGGSTDD